MSIDINNLDDCVDVSDTELDFETQAHGKGDNEKNETEKKEKRKAISDYKRRMIPKKIESFSFAKALSSDVLATKQKLLNSKDVLMGNTISTVHSNSVDHPKKLARNQAMNKITRPNITAIQPTEDSHLHQNIPGRENVLNSGTANHQRKSPSKFPDYNSPPKNYEIPFQDKPERPDDFSSRNDLQIQSSSDTLLISYPKPISSVRYTAPTNQNIQIKNNMGYLPNHPGMNPGPMNLKENEFNMNQRQMNLNVDEFSVNQGPVNYHRENFPLNQDPLGPRRDEFLPNQGMINQRIEEIHPNQRPIINHRDDGFHPIQGPNQRNNSFPSGPINQVPEDWNTNQWQMSGSQPAIQNQQWPKPNQPPPNNDLRIHQPEPWNHQPNNFQNMPQQNPPNNWQSSNFVTPKSDWHQGNNIPPPPSQQFSSNLQNMPPNETHNIGYPEMQGNGMNNMLRPYWNVR